MWILLSVGLLFPDILAGERLDSTTVFQDSTAKFKLLDGAGKFYRISAALSFF